MTTKSYFHLLVAAALVDGRLQPRERQQLEDGARQLGLSADEARTIFQGVKQNHSLAIPDISEAEREAILDILFDITTGDRRIFRRERLFLERIIEALELPAEKMDQLWERLEAKAVAEPPEEEELSREEWEARNLYQDEDTEFGPLFGPFVTTELPLAEEGAQPPPWAQQVYRVNMVILVVLCLGYFIGWEIYCIDYAMSDEPRVREYFFAKVILPIFAAVPLTTLFFGAVMHTLLLRIPRLVLEKRYDTTPRVRGFAFVAVGVILLILGAVYLWVVWPVASQPGAEKVGGPAVFAAFAALISLAQGAGVLLFRSRALGVMMTLYLLVGFIGWIAVWAWLRLSAL